MTSATSEDIAGRSHPGSRPRGRIGRVVAGWLATGLVAAVALVFAPFVAADDSAVTGAVLCGFALGWTTLVADQEFAAATSRAILDVVTSVRQAGPPTAG